MLDLQITSRPQIVVYVHGKIQFNIPFTYHNNTSLIYKIHFYFPPVVAEAVTTSNSRHDGLGHQPAPLSRRREEPDPFPQNPQPRGPCVRRGSVGRTPFETLRPAANSRALLLLFGRLWADAPTRDLAVPVLKKHKVFRGYFFAQFSPTLARNIDSGANQNVVSNHTSP